MEGMLFKWTSYLSGWQPRYFVLDGPFLSYYISHEDVGKTTEGSITMSMCEINERSKGDHALRAKMSEMQLYCHLLVEQMQMLQGCAGLPECQAQSLVEASSFLRQTCCQFLMSLEDCMAMCTCRAGTQQCRLLSPVSPSAVDCPNPHHKPPGTGGSVWADSEEESGGDECFTCPETQHGLY
ncbi:hypothetical protein JZ751_023339 [Albula glossodonta]|uniref:PH domain-containing protein n=1 Tax=Albula glossodonta TaxID=121402 RepID=A0A8T2NGH0_9TELE|nr:hypothetical protein JZ751_023339 [Albula glossodonta]